MKLEQIYFDDSIRDYALKLTGNKLEAEELISIAFEICLSKPPVENLKGYFAMVMRNQYLKRLYKQDPYFDDQDLCQICYNQKAQNDRVCGNCISKIEKLEIAKEIGCTNFTKNEIC